MNSLFTWHAPAVKKLLGWRQGSEEEKWAEKAVDSLVKKLKKKKSGPGTVEDLEQALANPGMHSKCVTIPKSLDGRLQVSHKKGLPHVIYCRVWRWPDLQSHQELRPVPECIYPYEQKSEHICINPYHYVRIENPHKAFMQQACTHGGYAASPYAESMASSSHSSGHPGQSSPALPTQIPSPMGSSYSTTSPTASSYVTATSPSSALSDDEADQRMDLTAHIHNEKMAELVTPIYWSTIGYYELNTRVGELFKLFNKYVVIDGFTDPSSSDSRICLGLISNVNRNAKTEETRKHIGRGLSLECTPEYNVHVLNQSAGSLFVQSRNANMKMNKPSGTVCRIPSGHHFCIFDNNLFCTMLQRACKEGQKALYDLQKMCFIRISFVKGWGPDYHRQDVTSTPCWIEIQLHQPLAWIDQNIRITDVPEGDANSYT